MDARRTRSRVEVGSAFQSLIRDFLVTRQRIGYFKRLHFEINVARAMAVDEVRTFLIELIGSRRAVETHASISHVKPE